MSRNTDWLCNRVYCIRVPGHNPLIFSFLSFSFLIGWEFYGPQLSKVLKPVRWAGSVIVQELCESRGGRAGLSVLTSLLVSVDVKIYCTVLRFIAPCIGHNPNISHDI